MTWTPRRATALLTCVTVVTCVGAAGCGGGPSTTTLRVSVTRSLSEALSALSRRYEESRHDVRIRLTFTGPSELTSDLDRRTAPDILIADDTATLDEVAKQLTGPRVIMAHNSLTIAVGPGNPKRIKGLPDLAGTKVRLALGAPSVPVGRYARRVFTKAGLPVPSALAAADSRSVLSRVRTGEADAGIVYITDLKTAGAAATWVPIPAVQNTVTDYEAAIAENTDHEDAARAFVTWLTEPAAKAVLKTHGFIAP